MATPRKKLFALEYLKDKNATQAAIRAGYSASTAKSAGHRLMKDPVVKAIISESMQEIVEELKIDAEWVLRNAKDLFDKCMDEDKFSPASAARALELIGKHTQVQAFKENLNINGTMQVMGSIKIGNKELDFDVGEPVEDEE